MKRMTDWETIHVEKEEEKMFSYYLVHFLNHYFIFFEDQHNSWHKTNREQLLAPHEFRKCKMLSLTFSSVCEKWVLHTFIVFWTFYDFILWNKNTNWRFECTIDQYYKHFLIVSVHILYYYYYYLYFFQDHHNSRRPLTTSKFSACMHSVTWWL